MHFNLQVNAHARPQQVNQNMIGWGEWPQEDHGADNFDLNQIPNDGPKKVGGQVLLDADLGNEPLQNIDVNVD
jgi:hypothetical protein